MLAKVKQDYRYKTVVAGGVEFVKYEPREVPAAQEAEVKRHPALEIIEPVVMILPSERKPDHEPKRTRK